MGAYDTLVDERGHEDTIHLPPQFTISFASPQLCRNPFHPLPPLVLQPVLFCEGLTMKAAGIRLLLPKYAHVFLIGREGWRLSEPRGEDTWGPKSREVSFDSCREEEPKLKRLFLLPSFF